MAFFKALKVSHEITHIIQAQTYVLVALVCNERELIEGVRLSQDGIVAGHAMRFGPVNLE